MTTVPNSDRHKNALVRVLARIENDDASICLFCSGRHDLDDEGRHVGSIRHKDDCPVSIARNAVRPFSRNTESGKVNLYAVSPRDWGVVVLVVAQDRAENAIQLAAEIAPEFSHWTVANTTTRCIQRNIDDEPRVVDVFNVFRQRRLP